MLLDRLDFFDCFVHCLSKFRMEFFRVFSFNDDRMPSETFEVLRQRFVWFARKDRRVRNLESVQIKNRQNGPVMNRINELVWLPGSCQRAGFCFTVADDGCCNQIGVVKDGARSVWKRISEFPAFMNGSRRLWSSVRSNAARERETLEELLHAFFIFSDFRVDFSIASVKVGIWNHYLSAVTRTFDVKHVQVIFVDDAVKVCIDEVLSGNRAPVSDWLCLDVGWFKRTSQQRIVF